MTGQTLITGDLSITYLHLEKLMYELVFMTQVTEQLIRNEIIDPRQFGFRSFHSTIHPLLITNNYIETKLRNKKIFALLH